MVKFNECGHCGEFINNTGGMLVSNCFVCKRRFINTPHHNCSQGDYRQCNSCRIAWVNTCKDGNSCPKCGK